MIWSERLLGSPSPRLPNTSRTVTSTASMASLTGGLSHRRRAAATTPSMHVSVGMPGSEVALPRLIIWLLPGEYAGRGTGPQTGFVCA